MSYDVVMTSHMSNYSWSEFTVSITPFFRVLNSWCVHAVVSYIIW